MGSHGLWEAEGAKKRRYIEKSREESKGGEKVELGGEKQFGRVKVIPVSKFMGRSNNVPTPRKTRRSMHQRET